MSEVHANPAAVASEIAASLVQVQRRIAAAAARVGRDPADVTLVAVSKTKPFSMIQAALAAGQLDFGENRIEELWDKVAEGQRFGLSQLRWHLIGTIQSRKSSQAVGPFVLIHSVDRVKIAQHLSRDAQAAGHVLSVLLEVNMGAEETKHGFSPAELVAVAPSLTQLSGLRIQGLMTMAPLVENAEAVRPLFRQLRELSDHLRQSCPQADWRHLSMGMTNDFEIAVEEGATLVRVGSAIFGARSE